MSLAEHIYVVSEPFSPEGALARFRSSMTGAGAIVSFTGVVRDVSGDQAVTGLHLQHYPGFTEKTILSMAQQAQERWTLAGLEIIHRVGDIAAAEPIVFVATASAHRGEAFAAADFLMDYLKSEAPFWKKEYRADGDTWIEPRTEDVERKERWK